VNAPGVLPLNSVGERLLALIARAVPGDRKLRDAAARRQARQVPLSRVVHDPRENIFIRPNDVIFVTREAPTFTALGALNQNVFGFNSESPFDVETLSLAQAMGKAGGLNDQQSDPGEISVYRYEDRHFLEKLGVDTTRFYLLSTRYRRSIASTCVIHRACCSRPVSKCSPKTSCTSPTLGSWTTTSCYCSSTTPRRP
jgi:polysaccharide biosynthesis/export protein